MSAAPRLPAPFGQWIDRDRPIDFTFAGEAYGGFAGDTIASALIAAGRWTLSRSFKYHRPRGAYSMAGQDANTIVQVPGEPNALADRTAISPGLAVAALNHIGGIDRDRGRLMELFARFLPVGFYYKTFYKPAALWPFWEKIIRRLAGLGHVEETGGRHAYFDKAYGFCDVAVIGGGPAGLSAALAAAEAGAEVALIDEQPRLGGALLYARSDAVGARNAALAAELLARLAATPRITVYREAVCQAWFADHFLPVTKGNRLHKLRAKATVVATGAMEQPLVFRANDLPGIMLGSAAQRLMRLYAVRPGKRAVVATANDDGYGVVLDLLAAGVEVAAVADLRATPAGPLHDAVRAAGVVLHRHATIIEAVEAANRVAAVHLAEIAGMGEAGRPIATIACDLVCLSVGYAPASALLHHAGATLAYDDRTAMTRISALPEGLFAAGSASGAVWDLDAVLADGARAGAAAALHAGYAATVPDAPADPSVLGITHPWPVFPHPKGKEFVDFDEDLQVKDITDAAAEGYDHIQLLKRYSTAGMGPSQGRMANVAVIRLLAKATGTTIQQVGTTTIRPPIGPEKIGHMAGRSFAPVRLTAMHERHVALGAVMMPAGDWMRPARYGVPESHAAEEALAVRRALGLIDVSTLGGIDVRGPDAAELLNRLYTGAYAKQPVGHARYLLMTDASGVVIDDGVAARFGAQHFYVTATTGGVDRVYRSMQWYNAQWRLAVDIAQVTAAYAAVNLAGPLSRRVLESLESDIDWSAAAFPYMGVRLGRLAGMKVRVLRVGFVGELGYEIHVPASHGAALWDVLMAAGRPHGIRPFGVEAQRLLRLEKGHIIVGQDTDGVTNPVEAGMGWAIAGKKGFFVGKQALDQFAASGPSRRLVGFTLCAEDASRVKECHLVVRAGEIVGRVTSVARSPSLDRVIGLAYVAPDQTAIGTTFTIKGEGGALVAATVAPTPFYDPENERQSL